MPVRRSLREAALAAALLAAFFVLAHGHALPPGRVLCADVLRPDGPRPENPLWDQALQFAPWLVFSGRELASGSLPLWNPHAGCGVAHAANDQSAVFHPLVVAAALLGPAWGLFFLALSEHVLAGLGVHFFLRARGLSVHAALAGGAAFAFSVPLVAWQGYPPALVLAALGWGLVGVERVGRGGGGAVLALAFAAALVGGHAQTALHVALAWSAYALSRAVPLGARGGAVFLLRALTASLLGAALAAPHVLLFLDELARSETLARRAAQGVQSPIPWRELAFLVFPDLDGNPRDGSYDPSRHGGMAWIELGEGSIGAAGVALAIAGALGPRGDPSARLARGALLLAGLGLAFVHDVPIFKELKGFPPFSLARNHRLVLVVAGALAVAAGAGAHAILHGRARPRAPGVFASGLLAAGVFAILAAFLRFKLASASLAQPVDGLARAFRGPELTHAAPLLAAAGVFALAHAARLGALPRRLVGSLLVLVVLVEQALVFANGFAPSVPHERFFRPTETTQALARSEPGERPRALVLGDLTVLPPNVLTAYGLDDVARYDVIGSRAFAPLRDAVGERSPNPDIECFQRVDARVARVLGVRDYVFREERLDPRLGPWDELASRLSGIHAPLGENVATTERFESALPGFCALEVVARLEGTPVATVELVLEPAGRRATASARPGSVVFRFEPASGPQTASFRRVDRGRGTVYLACCDGGRGERSFEGTPVPGKPLALSVAGLSPVAPSLAAVTSRVLTDRDALPRVRWVGRALAVASVESAVALLTTVDARTTVVLVGQEDGGEGREGRAHLVRYGSGRIEAASEGDAGWVVLADAWHPDWRASVDGDDVELLRAYGALRAVRVPAGPHAIVFRYAPRALPVGAALSAAALALLVALARRRRALDPANDH